MSVRESAYVVVNNTLLESGERTVVLHRIVDGDVLTDDPVTLTFANGTTDPTFAPVDLRPGNRLVIRIQQSA
jgi:hypothetical protein